MICMVTTTYPTTSTIEAGKAYVEAMAKPLPHMNEVGIWVCYGGDGIKTVAIQEVEKGYEDEALKALSDYFVPFLKIEGFKVKIETVLKAVDALSLVGMAPPD